jgi:hypothetical protein
MSNIYKATSEWGKATYGDDEVELDLSAADEGDMLKNGHMVLVPRKYRVTSSNYFPGQGEEIETTYYRDNEEALIAGGHIVRVDDPKPAKKSTTRPAKKAQE